MREAKFYLYRNLHKPGCFSVKYKGKVISVARWFLAEGVSFKVSALGRKRVIKEKRKNVHAFAVADTFYTQDDLDLQEVTRASVKYDNGECTEITYNPYTMDSFQWKNSCTKVEGVLKYVVLEEGKVYGIK